MTINIYVFIRKAVLSISFTLSISVSLLLGYTIIQKQSIITVLSESIPANPNYPIIQSDYSRLNLEKVRNFEICGKVTDFSQVSQKESLYHSQLAFSLFHGIEVDNLSIHLTNINANIKAAVIIEPSGMYDAKPIFPRKEKGSVLYKVNLASLESGDYTVDFYSETPIDGGRIKFVWQEQIISQIKL